MEQKPKPIFWEPNPHIGYSVERRPDGGMNVTFHHLDLETVLHWRDFALQHLIYSEQLTRNLYDLRAIQKIPEEFIQFAIEANSDPASRHIRMAVVVTSPQVADAVEEIRAQTLFPGGTEMKVFTDLETAEAWLTRPLGPS